MKSKKDDNVKQNIILDFLKTAGLVIDNSLNTLEGQVIPRDLLLLTEKYEECKTKIDFINKSSDYIHIFSNLPIFFCVSKSYTYFVIGLYR